jgi:ribosomal protein L2
VKVAEVRTTDTSRQSCGGAAVRRISRRLEKAYVELKPARRCRSTRRSNDGRKILQTHNADTPFQTVVSREDITKQTPEKSLVKGKRARAGAAARARFSSRSAAAATRKAYREIDFKRDKTGSRRGGSIEYDPNRSARIALLALRRRREALHPGSAGLEVGARCSPGRTPIF